MYADVEARFETMFPDMDGGFGSGSGSEEGSGSGSESWPDVGTSDW